MIISPNSWPLAKEWHSKDFIYSFRLVWPHWFVFQECKQRGTQFSSVPLLIRKNCWLIADMYFLLFLAIFVLIIGHFLPMTRTGHIYVGSAPLHRWSTSQVSWNASHLQNKIAFWERHLALGKEKPVFQSWLFNNITKQLLGWSSHHLQMDFFGL